MKPQRSKAQTKDSRDYGKVDPVTHVLKRPVMYVGPVSQTKRKDYHMIDGKSVFKHTMMAFGMRHIYDELLSNVADNADNSRFVGIDPGECTIVVKGARITVTNGGLCIPIKMKKGQLIPRMIFEDMYSGSALGEDRTTGATHGIGAKATNILSNEFSVKICNAQQGKMCTIVWKNNMSIKGKELIELYDGDESSVEISYIADPKVFGFGGSRRSYEEHEVEAFYWRAACLSLTAQIPVTFNGIRMEHTLESFAETFLDSSAIDWKMPKHFIVDIIEEPKKVGLPPLHVRAIVLDTPSKSFHLGFANHIVNPNGGVHVNAPIKCLKDHILSNLSLKDSAIKIDIGHIKTHMSVIVTVTGVLNPEWGGGQAKTSMTAPKIPMLILDKHMKGLKTWGIFTAMNAQISAKALEGLSIVEPGTRKGRYILSKLGEDATWAGTSKSHLCNVYIVEGDSAWGYFSELLDFLDGGKKTNGVIALRGKPLNVLKCTDTKLLKNKEIREIVTRLGLEPGKEYVLIDELRYGKILFLADADLDGMHIKGLLLALFRKHWPSILKIEGFVVDYLTPYLRLTKGKTTLKFFFPSQYLRWQEENPNETGWTERYYKGLGSSELKDIKDDYDDLHEVQFICDRNASDSIDLAMGPSKIHADDRRAWIMSYNALGTKDIINGKLSISTFIDGFLLPYSYSTIARNMSSLADGMSEVQRKIIASAFTKWGGGSKAALKVTDFAGYVGALMKYHHGPAIEGSIINMGQTHTGSNNLPYLYGKGRFGNMERGLKNAASGRYLEVCISTLLRYIIKAEDTDILTLSTSDGIEVEPVCFLPIIPLGMVNGTDSISTGWRSKIPSYDPLMLIDTYLARLNGVRFKEPQPFYRHHKGTNTIENGVFTSVGVAEIISKNSYIVTCLPAGMWNWKYYKTLMQWVIAGKISDFESDCTATRTHFTVHGLTVTNENGDPRRLTVNDLGITSHYSLTNITLMSPNGFPTEYANVRSTMEDFYTFRLPYFDKRKNSMMAKHLAGIDKAQKKLAYVIACYDGSLSLTRPDKKPAKRAEIIARIEDLGLEKGFYINVPGYTKVDQCDCDDDGIALIEKNIAHLLEQYNILKNKTAADLWREDLLELRSKYLSVYDEDTGDLKVPVNAKERKVPAGRGRGKAALTGRGRGRGISRG